MQFSQPFMLCCEEGITFSENNVFFFVRKLFAYFLFFLRRLSFFLFLMSELKEIIGCKGRVVLDVGKWSQVSQADESCPQADHQCSSGRDAVGAWIFRYSVCVCACVCVCVCVCVRQTDRQTERERERDCVCH